MAEQLKNYFNEKVPVILARQIKKYVPDFADTAFIHQALNGFSELELMSRGRKLAYDLHGFLPKDFPKALLIIQQSMQEPLTHTDYEPRASFFYHPHLHYIATFGLDFPEISLNALKEMTTLYSAEFAIRPFIERYPELVFKTLHEWKTSENVHVRRLVSEGTRPRLPWASRLKDLEEHPEPSIELLDFLKDDTELYVRRSVANHLNDISKVHPDLVLSYCEKWLKSANENRLWVIKHALRTLIKKGNAKALEIIGFKTTAEIKITQVELHPKKIKMGETLHLSASLLNPNAVAYSYLVDYKLFFVKHNGKLQSKVFKWKTIRLEAKSSITIHKEIAFIPLSTRKYYSGIHKIELMVNGNSFHIGEFELIVNSTKNI